MRTAIQRSYRGSEFKIKLSDNDPIKKVQCVSLNINGRFCHSDINQISIDLLAKPKMNSN